MEKTKDFKMVSYFAGKKHTYALPNKAHTSTKRLSKTIV